MKETVPAAKKKDAVLDFSVIFQNYHGEYLKKPAGSVHSIGKSKDDINTLQSLNMKIGDCMDVSIKTSAPKEA